MQWSSYMVDIPRYGHQSIYRHVFLHHKDSTSGMDANNTIHDDFTVAHLIILGEMYCSPIQLDISITEEDQGKYDRNIMGVDGLGCQMDG